jgi:hypothetical protein
MEQRKKLVLVSVPLKVGPIKKKKIGIIRAQLHSEQKGGHKSRE